MGLFEAIGSLLEGSAREADADPLRSAVASALPDAEEDTHAIVTAVVGLLCTVAYADGVYHEAEAKQIRAELRRLEGMTAGAHLTLSNYVDTHLKQIAVRGDQRWVRDLKTRATKQLRLEVLDVLIGLAAADGSLDHSEVGQLRRLAMGLGLGQDAYNQLQEKHRDVLSRPESS